MLLALLASLSAAAAPPAHPVRIGLTPAIVHDQYELLADWRNYLELRLKRRVEFVLRDSYRDTFDLLHRDKLDFAWVSDYPYVYLKKTSPRLVRLMSTPIYHGTPKYRAYLIVPASDARTKSLADLKGTVFAYADPYSHTGYLVPRYELKMAGLDPNRFFRRTFFTWSHRKIVEAVAQGFAEAGSVDGFVWDSLSLIQPNLTQQTRIVSKSEEFGFPPLVAHRSVSQEDFTAMQDVLMNMSRNPEGVALLKRLNIDGFGRGDDKLYDGVTLMMRAFDEE